MDSPFHFTDSVDNGVDYTNPPNYAYSGLYQMDDPQTGDFGGYHGSFDALELFAHNAHYRNFIFNTSDLDGNGRLNTGATSYNGDTSLILSEPAKYQFTVPASSGASISALLATNDTQWLGTYPMDSPPDSYLSEIGITNSSGTYFMAGNAKNLFGLPFISTIIANSSGTTLLSAGGNTTQGGSFYPETAQPQFQLEEYDLSVS